MFVCTISFDAIDCQTHIWQIVELPRFYQAHSTARQMHAPAAPESMPLTYMARGRATGQHTATCCSYACGWQHFRRYLLAFLRAWCTRRNFWFVKTLCAQVCFLFANLYKFWRNSIAMTYYFLFVKLIKDK